jgi:radical SAM superfamily enzyme YgiQ (UPF0313 family)
MSRVVLVNPPVRLARPFTHYPTFDGLGTLSNAAFLKACGHDVRVVDAFSSARPLNVRRQDAGLWHVGAEVDLLAERARAAAGECPDEAVVVVALTMHSDMNRPHENPVAELTRALRRALPGAHVGLADLHVCGTNYVAFDAARVLEALPEAEFVVEGESERALHALVERYASGGDPAGLACVSRRGRGGVTGPASRAWPFTEDLDTLPPPAFDAIDVDAFFANLADAIRAGLVHEYVRPERMLPFQTSRGCPFRCSFCTNAVRGVPWRAHSVRYVVEELTALRDRHGVERFLFFDDNINYDVERFRRLARALAEARLAWDVVAGCRADRLDREIIRLAREAGTSRITVSAESGSPAVLAEIVGKDLDLGAVAEAARLCAEEDVPLAVHYVIGMPGETRRDMNRTLLFARDLLERYGARPLVQHAVPYHGTRLAERSRAEGLLIAPLSDIPGHLLNRHSVIRTSAFSPGEVDRLRANAARLFESMLREPDLDLDVGRAEGASGVGPGAAGPAGSRIDHVRRLAGRRQAPGGRSLWLVGTGLLEDRELPGVVHEARAAGFERVTLVADACASPAPTLVAALRPDCDHVVLDLASSAGAPTAGFVAALADSAREMAAWWHGSWEALLPLRGDVAASLEGAATSLLALGARHVTLHLPALAPPDADSRHAHDLAGLLRVARRASARHRDGVRLRGVPLCLLPASRLRSGPPWAWHLRRLRRFKDPLPGCLECVALLLCEGPWAEERDAQGTRAAVGRRLRRATAQEPPR